ncbi:hypothetical protein PVAND_004934 [Polypedilum vanderplanki]|uniref:ZAD domain-containing protein n=1 Tax=Polypedilum vanderplanki TaxID=319348 RepID=A0A9J6BYE0_POLVA|nr:hypothetical protein PVAND_004934 [Polypedilum vanderplanki]
MKRKGNCGGIIIKNNGIVELLKRSREHISSTTTCKDENHNTSKKYKYDAKLKQTCDRLELIKLVDERVENAIDIGFKIYKQNESNDFYSDSERYGFLSILKKIQNWQDWNFKRIFKDKKQLQCLLKKENIEKQERKEALHIVEQWNEYKLSEFPGKSRREKCRDVSNHYINRFKVAGLNNDRLLEKINQYYANESISSISNSTKCNNDSLISQSSQQNFSSSSLPSVIEDCCRLCGDKDCKLVINLNKKYRNTTFKNTVEYFCRLEISDDDRLPQFVCIKCKNTLDNFTFFTSKIKSFQQELNDSLPSSTTINIKIEPEEYKEAPITIEKSYSQEEDETHTNVAEDDTSFNICSYSPILLESSKESMSVESTHSQTKKYNKNRTRYFSTSLSNLDISVSSHKSTLLFESMANQTNRSMKISNIDMKKTVKPCTVKIPRLPIIYYPSDTESESEEIEDIFSSGFTPESSSPIVPTKFCIKEESSKEAAAANIDDEEMENSL